ncbi:MAG: metallophosphoesterase [Nitrososphaerota archaeon]
MRRLSRRGFIGVALLGIAAGATASSAASLNNELDITRLEIGLGARLAFVPDLHYYSRGEKRVESATDAIIRAEPDIIVLGGDLVDEETRDFEGLEEFLGMICCGEDIAVMGNHEYWSGYAGRAVTLLRRSGFKILFNKFTETSIGRVYGYDWSENRAYPRITFDGLIASHDPNAADSVEEASLVLAGHTHGGINLFGVTLYSNSKYSRGIYHLARGIRLYVSRGLGQMRLQPRINSRPELLLVE